MKDYSANLLANESALIRQLYADVGTGQFFSGFMESLALIGNVRSGILSISNLRTNSIAGGWVWNVEEEAMDRYMSSGWAANDLLLNYILDVDPAHIYSVGLHTPEARDNPNRNHVFKVWARPLDIWDAAMALLARQDSWVCSLVLHRRQAQGDFTEAELSSLARLLPHVRRAVSLHSGMKSPQQQQEAISPWLSLIKTPVLLFNERFTCSDQNEAATHFFEQQSRVRLEEGWITFDDAAATREISVQIMRAMKNASAGDVATPSYYTVAGNPPTQFLLLPVQGAADSSFASVLVFIHQDDFVPPIKLDALSKEFGFTEAEAEVCRLLVRGLSLEEIAAQQQKSKETVRSQIKQAFSKTATNGQAELVVRLLTHPLALEG